MNRPWLLALALSLAHAGGVLAYDEPPPVARVFVDGEDVDGPPPGPTHIPGWLGASLWPVAVSTTIHANTPGIGPVDTGVKSATGVNASVYLHQGYYSAALDAIQTSQSLTNPYTLAGTTFAAGSAFKQTDIVVRGSRELYRFDMPWAHYHVDAGLRYTLGQASFDNAGLATVRTTGYLSPELLFSSVHAFDDTFALHTRSSVALNGATSSRELSWEFAAFLNYHLFETDQGVHDAAVGVRFASYTLSFTDTTTAQETTLKNTFLGPEFTYAIHW